MSNARLKLERLAIGTTLKAVQTTCSGSYVFNMPENFETSALTQTFLPASAIDTFNFTDLVTGEQIVNLYPAREFVLSSEILQSQPSETDVRLQQIFPHTVSGCVFISQFDDQIIGMTQKTFERSKTKFFNEQLDTIPSAWLILPTSALDDADFDAYRRWGGIEPYVAIYLPSGEIALSAGNDAAFSPKWLLSGVAYNWLAEIPCDHTSYYPDFENGILSLNAGNMKNMYDPRWNVSGSVSADYTGASGVVVSASLVNCRFYTNMRVNYETLWATYTFGDQYVLSSQTIVLSGIGWASESNIYPTVLPMSAVNSIPATSAYGYEHLERIAGFNRITPTQLHKSNLFSIRINNSGVNEGLAVSARTNVQTSITNIIENIIGKIIPAHTQLFRVFYTGE
jgi:hypothetical protein